MDCGIGFTSPAAFHAFAEELASQVATLAPEYDDATARSRRFRVHQLAPVVTKTAADAAAETARRDAGNSMETA